MYRNGPFKFYIVILSCSQVDHSRSFYLLDYRNLILTGQNGYFSFVTKELYHSRVQIQRTEYTGML